MNKIYQIKFPAKDKALYDTRSREGAKLAKLRQNAILRRGSPSLYWPSRCGVDSKLWPYAIACLEAALQLSDTAVNDYAKIVEAWELPGCQELKHNTLECQDNTSIWADQAIKAYSNRDMPPELPGMNELWARFRHNKDFNDLMTQAAIFILHNFNRQIDLSNENYRIIPGPQSTLLIKAVTMRSIIDHTEYDAAKLHRYQYSDIEHIMTVKPKPRDRDGRRIRHNITTSYKDEGFNLKADDTFLFLGEKWYRARVLCKTLTEAANHYRIDPLDLSKDIRPCDDASGYPYKK